MAPPTINWGTKVISVPKSFLTLLSGTAYSLDTNAFRIALKDLEDDEAGIPFPPTHSHNTSVTLGGIQYARIIEMINGYTITFEDGVYSVSLIGSNNNILDVTNLNQVSIRANNSAGLINVVEVQQASFNGSVTIDENNVSGLAEVGTNYPTGTMTKPCSNLADAKLIAAARGFDTFNILGNITLQNGHNVSGYKLVGSDKSTTTITLVSGCITTGAYLENATITGTCGGRMDINNCNLNNIYSLCASLGDAGIKDCHFSGTIQLSSLADQMFDFIDCIGESGAGTPTIDINNCSATIHIGRWSGNLRLSNGTNISQLVSLDIFSGHIILENSIVAGAYNLRGTAKLSNQTTANDNLAIDTSGLQIPVIDQYNETIYFDSLGSAGSDYPVGLLSDPVNNIPDMLSLASKFLCSKLHFHSDATISSGADLSHYSIEAHATFKHLVTFASGCIMENSIVRNIKLTGVMGGWCVFERVLMINVSNILGNIGDALLEGNIGFKNDPTAHIQLENIRSNTQAPVNISIGLAEVNCINAFGMFTLKDKTGITEFNMHCGYGFVVVDSSCVAGVIYIAGNGFIQNNANGSMVICNGRVIPNDGVVYSQVVVADEVIAASQITPINVNVKKINDATVYGNGTEGSKWRGNV